MMPLQMFASRQFSAANAVTFVVYAALGGVFFLLVAFLQISLGYSPIAAGAASLPVTVLMLLLSARSGALAQRIGPRIPLTVGPLVIATGLLLMTQIQPGDSYVSSVLPAVIVFGLGLTLVVAPVTATVLAAADAQHAGIASGINNAVSRVAGLLAVAVLPVIGGLTGDNFYNPAKMTDGFHVAMLACAGLAVAGGILAWLTISSEVLAPEADLEGAMATPAAPRVQLSGRGHAAAAWARGGMPRDHQREIDRDGRPMSELFRLCGLPYRRQPSIPTLGGAVMPDAPHREPVRFLAFSASLRAESLELRARPPRGDHDRGEPRRSRLGHDARLRCPLLRRGCPSPARASLRPPRSFVVAWRQAMHS